jgi:outer membrane protein
MKNIIAGLLVVSATLPACKSSSTKDTPAASTTSTSQVATPVNGAKIAYVNIDTLEANYELLKTKKEEFKQRQSQMEAELQSSYQKMQADAAEVQKKAQSNTLTQPEYESAQKRLMQMEKSLETRKQTLTDQLVKEQDEFNKDLKKRLDAFIEEYNKTRHYDYILSYSSAGGSSIIYANKDLDITKDVVAGMNATAKANSK